MIVISDTAPLIIFGKRSKLELLKELYNEILNEAKKKIKKDKNDRR